MADSTFDHVASGEQLSPMSKPICWPPALRMAPPQVVTATAPTASHTPPDCCSMGGVFHLGDASPPSDTPASEP